MDAFGADIAQQSVGIRGMEAETLFKQNYF
jgi:hypothetical protein